MHLDAVELIGWMAAACTIGVYTMRTMLPLRVFGVLANVFFIAFGYLDEIWPTFFLHLVLLPINMSRLVELLLTYRKVRAVRAGEPSLDWLERIEATKRYEAGAPLFQLGDTAEKIYYLKSGTVRIEEIERDLGPGDIFGEVAFFTEARLRTASARCLSDCELIEIDEKTFMRVFYQSPAFGTFLTRLLAQRLADATARLQAA